MIESKAWKRERGRGAPLEMFPSLSWQCPAPGLGWNSPHPGNLLKSRSQAQILTLSKRLKISFASSIMAVLAESAWYEILLNCHHLLAIVAIETIIIEITITIINDTMK